ncbi:MAG: TonB-dependent receptor [Candidatus Eremiobacteraeota bacterium]|nr:TonB-dependent receptor [Candidatus Eremiobacteraeota bacterium]
MIRTRVLSAVALAALIGGAAGTAPAYAQSTTAQNTPATAVQITGTATDPQGTPLPGVTVTLSGPRTYTTTTGALGRFTLAVIPGIYTANAQKGGFNPAQVTDYAVVAGTPGTLNVSLQQTTFSSLREIGRTSTTVSRSGSTFNTSPAAVASVGRTQIEDQNATQVMRLLDETPGIVTGHPSSTANATSPGAITFPNVRGGLGFETAALLDGHPLSVGRFGDYVTTFLDADTFQNIEVIKGPGASSPVINYAINGSVNFRTIEPTRRPAHYLRFGADSFGGLNLGMRTTGSFGKLGYALVYASDGTQGPITHYPTNIILPSNVLLTGRDANGNPVNGYLTGNGYVNGTGVGSANDPNPVAGQRVPNPYVVTIPGNRPFTPFTTLVACCQPISTNYNSRNELVKLRWNFTPSMSFTATYLGMQAYANQAGNNFNQVAGFFVPTPAYNPNGALASRSPIILNTTAGTVGALSDEHNNEPVFQGEFRTAVGRDNFIARAYTASINRLITNIPQSANESYSQGYQLFGTATITPVGSSTPGNYMFNGQQLNVTFPSAGTVIAGKPTGGVTQYFRQTEHDKLRGYSVEYDHFLGDSGNIVSASYDTYHSSTYTPTISGAAFNATTGAVTDNLSVAIADGAYQRNSTLQLRALLNINPKTTLTIADYVSTFFTHASLSDQTSGTPVVRFYDVQQSHNDPRLAITYRANRDLSLRGSVGSSIAAPYINLYSATLQTPAQAFRTGATSVSIGRAATDLKPETAFGYDFGADMRLHDGQTLISADYYLTNLFNQFLTASMQQGTFTPPGGSPIPVLVTAPFNISNARYEGVELRVQRDPAVGFGYTASGSLVRAYPYNLPPNLYLSGTTQYATNLAVIPNINFQGGATGGGTNGVSNQSIPYSQAFAELRYRPVPQALASVGATYYGPNNSFNRDPFTLVNLSARFPVLDKYTTLQISGDNVFNFGGSQPYILNFSLNTRREPLTGGLPPALLNLNSIPARTFTFTLRRTWGG